MVQGLSPGRVVSGSIESFVLPRPDRRLGHDEQLVDLSVAQFVVVGVAVTISVEETTMMMRCYDQ